MGPQGRSPLCGDRTCVLSFALQCGAPFQEEDVIVLNGTKEDVEMLKSRMEERRLKARLGKVAGVLVCVPPLRRALGQSLGSARPPPCSESAANHRAALLAAASGSGD